MTDTLTLAANDTLYQLIQSLSKSQKRYFKLYCGDKEKESNYLKIFETYDKLKEFDEKKILKKLKGEKFVKHLASEKNYLYELILKAMRAYSAEKSVDAQLRMQLMDIEFLYQHRLIKQCVKRLQKTMKQAVVSERFNVQLELLNWEVKLQPLILKKGRFREHDEYLQRRVELLAKMEQLQRLDSFSSKLQSCVIKTHDSRDKEILDLAKRTFEELEASGVSINMSWRMKNRYLVACIYYSMINQQRQKAYQYNLELLNHYDEQPIFKKIQLKEYKGTIHNILVMGRMLKDYSLQDHYITIYNELPSYSQTDLIDDFRNVTASTFLYYLGTCKWKELEELVPKIEASLQSLRTLQQRTRQTISYNLAAYYFVSRNWEKCQELITRIIELNTEERIDIKRSTRWMEVMCYVETTSDETAHYILQSNYRFIRSKELHQEFDSMIYQFFRKLLQMPKAERKTWTAKNLEVFSEYLKTQNRISGATELLIWMRSRVEGLSMREIHEENSLKNVPQKGS